MAAKSRTISVAPDSDLAKLLDQAAFAPLRVEVDGVFYRVEVEPSAEDWRVRDPERVRQVLRRTAGSWADLDIDAEIEKVNSARVAGSRPATRP